MYPPPPQSIFTHPQDPTCTELSASPGGGGRAQKYTMASALGEFLGWRNSSVVQYLPVIHGGLGFVFEIFEIGFLRVSLTVKPWV